MRVGAGERGEECGASDVEFLHLLPEIPEVAILESLAGSPLVGIAWIGSRHGELYMDCVGRLFGVSLMHDACWLAGENFAEAMTGLLLGHLPRPILLPGQSEVDLYGIKFLADDPRVYPVGPAGAH